MPENILETTRKKLLTTIITYCLSCKKVLSDDNTWISSDIYLAQHHDASISHGICPECCKKALAKADISEEKTNIG